jgi:hypothetical protein
MHVGAVRRTTSSIGGSSSTLHQIGHMYMEQDTGSALLVFYLLYAITACVVLAVSVGARIATGVPFAEFLRTRGYELPPIRLAIHVVHLSLWFLTLYAAITALRHGWAFIDLGGAPYGWTALVAAVVAGGAGLLAWGTLTRMVRIGNNSPPSVLVDGLGRQQGIDPHALSTLGMEQFPQMLAYGGRSDLQWRRWLIGAGVIVLLLVLAGGSEWGHEQGLYDVGNGLVGLWLGTLSLLPVPPAGVRDAMLLSAVLGCALMVIFNGTYTLMTFRRTLGVGLGLLCIVWWSRASVAEGEAVIPWTAVLWLAFSVRWGYDLYRAHGFRKVQHVTQPIAQGIRGAVPFLGSLPGRPDCRLPALDDRELGGRISRGCRNVEAASPLVTRNLARFMSLVHVEHEHFAAAMLRYLTVRRYVTAADGGGTTRPLQDPEVPVWNEVLFPIRPPRGFRNWLDPLGLGSEWDQVSICSGCGGSGEVRCGDCGGSGRQQRTETYTEYSGGRTTARTRSVTVTCSGCGGSGRVRCRPCDGRGRVVFHRTLNTQWQRLLPACTAPYTLLPEFMEEAEERTYFRLPLVENRMQLPPRPEHDGIDPDLETRLAAAVDDMSSSLPAFAGMVERLHDGRVYRADFQVTGFQVLRIGFERLGGKVGWFFGKRPEFYFPVLPLSWSMVGTVLFVAPFLLLTALLVFAIAGGVLAGILPELY